MTVNLKPNRRRNNVNAKNAAKRRQARIQKGVYNKCDTKNQPLNSKQKKKVEKQEKRKQEKQEKKILKRKMKEEEQAHKMETEQLMQENNFQFIQQFFVKMKNLNILMIVLANCVISELIQEKRDEGVREVEDLDNKQLLMNQAKQLIDKGKKKFRKLSMKLEKEPNYLEEKGRKLLFGDLSANEMMGLMGGIGGLALVSNANNHYNDSISEMQKTKQYQDMRLVMQFNKRKQILEEIFGIVQDLEDRISDMDSRVSLKVQRAQDVNEDLCSMN